MLLTLSKVVTSVLLICLLSVSSAAEDGRYPSGGPLAVPFVPKTDGPKEAPQNKPLQQQAPELPAKGEVLYQPKDVVRMAANDIEKNVPATERPRTRYLTLYNIPAANRDKMIKVLSFVCNSLSRNPRIWPVYVVPDTDNTLIRISMDNYRWTNEAWDKLAATDYVFTVNLVPVETPTITTKTVKKTVKRPVEVRVMDSRGRIQTITREEEVEVEEKVSTPSEKPKQTIVRAVAPWLQKDVTEKLLLYAQAKETAILRADWFIVKATVPPAYYDFLQFGNKEGDFQKALALNDETIKIIREELSKESKGAVIRSGVTRNNRRLARITTPLGYYYYSSDFLKNIDQANMLRILITDNPDASEQIATAANGLQWYFIVNKARTRLDEADINVAVDDNYPDHKVITGRSCMTCHNTGVLSFSSDSKRLVRDYVSLGTIDPNVKQYLLTVYDVDFKELFDEDQTRFAKAVRKCNNLTVEANATAFKEAWLAYAEHDLTLAEVAVELGYEEKEVRKAFEGTTDPVLLGLVNKEPSRARREHWEEVFSIAMLAMTKR